MSLITITTGLGCSGSEVAERVARELDIVVYDDDRMQQEALNMGFSPQDVERFEQSVPGFLMRLLRRRPAEYLELMASAVYEVARRGEGIIIGHGAPYFLKDFGCALHVRIYASEKFRVDQLVAQKKISEKEAKKLIKKSDADLKGFLQFSFQMDLNDISLYDAVINVSKIGIDSAAAQIVALAKTREIRECSLTALETMEKLSLLKRVEGAMLKHNINPQELVFAVPEPGIVEITGMISPMRTISEIVEILNPVAGVKKVYCKAQQHPLGEI